MKHSNLIPAEEFAGIKHQADREVLLQRMGGDEKKSGPDFSSGGNLEEALHKSHMPLNGTFAYSLVALQM